MHRWIKVGWGETNGEIYDTSIQIMARERSGLIMDVATILNLLKLNIKSLNARDIGDGIAMIYIEFGVRDREELSQAMRKLGGIHGVSEVKRV